MSKIIQQNDHIILPKSTLLRFADTQTKKVHYLDISNPNELLIKSRSPKSFHTKENYYDPVFDHCVQGFETLIGEWYIKLSSAFSAGTNVEMTPDVLKQDIVDLITIQFHRSVIADDDLLEKYKKQQQQRNDLLDAELLKQGKLTSERVDYSTNFRSKAGDVGSFRFYAQNILSTKNNTIQETYRTFAPYVLYIPSDVKSKFLLTPQHFVANDGFARFILSPQYALALYPKVANSQYIRHLTEAEITCMDARTIESTLSVTPEYRQVVGGKVQLEKVKMKLESFKSAFAKGNSDEITIDEGKLAIKNLQELQEMIVSIILFEPNTKIVQVNNNLFFDEFLKGNRDEIIGLFEKYRFTCSFSK